MGRISWARFDLLYSTGPILRARVHGFDFMAGFMGSMSGGRHDDDDDDGKTGDEVALASNCLGGEREANWLPAS